MMGIASWWFSPGLPNVTTSSFDGFLSNIVLQLATLHPAFLSDTTAFAFNLSAHFLLPGAIARG